MQRGGVLTGRSEAPPPHEAMLAQLGAFVGSLTRFDAASLATRRGASTWVSARAALRFEVAIDSKSGECAGGLPAGFAALPNPATLPAHVGSLVSEARAALPGRVQVWLAGHPNEDSGPTSSDGYSGPRRFGCTSTCTSCGGRGDNACTACGATGKQSCSRCGGRGFSSCPTCGGGGQRNCTTCGGSGTQNSMEAVQVANHAGPPGTHTVYESRNRPCTGCYGRGKLPCEPCNSSGRQNCYACFQTGRVDCSTCGGTTRQRCSPCAGSGKRSLTFEIECRVTSSFRLEIASQDPMVREVLGPFSLSDLRAQGEVERDAPQLGGGWLERLYSCRVRITDLFVAAGGRDYRLIGVGPGVASAISVESWTGSSKATSRLSRPRAPGPSSSPFVRARSSRR